MKKYLIDQDQMTYLLRILRCYPLMYEELKKLKPIELLSDKDLCDIYANVTGQNLLNRETFLMFCFGRAIEAHIIGETP